MRTILLSISLVAVISMACFFSAELPLGSSSVYHTVTATHTDLVAVDEMTLVTITGNVYIRDPENSVVGLLVAGVQVRASCGQDLCYLRDGNTIWRGCTDQAHGRRCLPK